MFQKPTHTKYPPGRPQLIWDGTCGFCKYWIIRWKFITGNAVVYAPYQQAGANYPDIEERHFREAVRLIMPDGTIYSGPQAAYMSMKLGGHYHWLSRLYISSAAFRWFSDMAYQWIADHRAFMMRLTKILVGKNPARSRPYWMFYLMIVAALLLLILL